VPSVAGSAKAGTAGVDFILQVAARPPGNFTVTIAVGTVNQQFGLARGTRITKPKAASQVIHVDGTADWIVKDLDIPAGASDFTATLTEVGGTRTGSDSGAVAQRADSGDAQLRS
jgi:hypothetical protein